MTRTVSIYICFAALLALAPTANAETITGTFQFLDGDNKLAPIRDADVEVYRRRSGQLHYEKVTTVRTNQAGAMRATVPFDGPNATFSLRVYATNSAVAVNVKDNGVARFYDKPGSPNPEILRTSTTAGDTLDFSADFHDEFTRGHFNVADAMLRGFAYANANRDPREAAVESIAPVTVQISSSLTYYDPVTKVVRVNWKYVMDDLSVLHEYAHYLEERISGFAGVPAGHDGCVATMGAIHVESPEYAWMEGFASYFAVAVANVFGADVDGAGAGMAIVENPSCPGAPQPKIALEAFVAAALQDLVDTSNETGDQHCSGSDVDRNVFQIFDRELDIGRNPSLTNFIDAWIARGFDLPPLVKTFGASQLTVTVPQAIVHYDIAPAANLAVWRPSGAQWWVKENSPRPPPVWGEPGDIPVPADYDGDAITDLAIWRPRDGNWWVVLSASGATQVRQWGTNGDVPLPADYDGDGEVDHAVYRPSTETVYIYSDNCGPNDAVKVGRGVPVAGKVTNAPRWQAGVYDPANGFTMWIRLANGTYSAHTLKVEPAADPAPQPTFGTTTNRTRSGFGVSTSDGELDTAKLVATYPPRPVLADYDGDRLSDAAVWSPNSGLWTVQGSKGVRVVQQWGVAGDIPVPADYDTDGVADFAVWRPGTGEWWILNAAKQSRTVQWGTNGDVPVPAK